jgi:hypothetical protein
MPGFNMNDKLRLALFLVTLVAWSYPFAAPRWVAHASLPGPDTTGVGQSRFDQLFFLDHNQYRIPYPFSRLIEFLDSRIENSDHSGVRQVLVPSGRSLQRDAPAPDYFSFPRVVIALEGEPVTTGYEAGEVLEYRLFIAHQPKTETLEVISYNDSAGRFEFQVVANYAANKTPRVQAVNRAMCLSCHQNAAPIFPSRPWSETSFNVRIANKLIATLPQQYNSLIGIVTTDANVIDVLVERANYLAAAQFIWQQGCSSRLCRATMLRAVLQYRLSGEASFDSSDKRYQHDYYAELTRNWKTRWPMGLALANSRIVDRDPFAAETMTFEQEALFPQPAHATWDLPDAVLANGIIYRLAGFFTRADIQRIDRHLIALGSTQPSIIRLQESSCKLETGDTSSNVLVCGDKTTAASLQADFEIDMQQGDPESIRIMHLRVPRDSNLLQPDIVRLSRFRGGLEIEPGNSASGLSLRLANGDRIKSLQLRWDDSLVTGEISLSLEIAAEFQLIDQALTKIVASNQRGVGDSLADNVFRRRAVMRELIQTLGMQPLHWRETIRSSSADVQPDPPELSGELALLVPYCAHCHAGDTVNPPGFLSGDQPQAKIVQCAPRILARLQAWQPDSGFNGSPMPPPASLEISGTTSADWPHSDHYHALVASIEKLVTAAAFDSAYQRLPACLSAIDE